MSFVLLGFGEVQSGPWSGPVIMDLTDVWLRAKADPGDYTLSA